MDLGIRKTDPQYQEILSRGKLWPLLYGTQAPSVSVRSGAVALFAPHHVIEPESGSSDDVTAFSGGQDGKVYLIRPPSGKTITVKHGVDNIFMVGGADLTLDAVYDVAQVIFVRSLDMYIAWSFGSAAGSVPTHAHGDLYYTETEVDGLFTVHLAAADPHPGYLTPAEHTAIGNGSPHHAPESGTSVTHNHDGSYEASGAIATHAADDDAHHVKYTDAEAVAAVETENPLDLAGLLLKPGTELTIAGGAITVTGARHTIDTEGDAASDDLDTISGLAEGEVCMLSPASGSRTVVLKHGTGNILIFGNADVSLDDFHDRVWAVGSALGTVAILGTGGAGGFTQEEIEDFVGAMFSGNTETGIAVTYQDADGTIDLVVSDLTVAGDSGSTGMTPGDTLTVAGGEGIDTAMSGDTLTVSGEDASDSNKGIVELATTAETNTGTDIGRAVTPDGLAGSYAGTKSVAIQVSDVNGDAITTGDGKAKLDIPSSLNGMNLVAVAASVSTVSSSGIPTVQLRRSRRSSATARTEVDMLSTKLTIDANEFSSVDAAAAAVINGSNDDVQTGDFILIDIDVAGTGAKGLGVVLEFRLP